MATPLTFRSRGKSLPSRKLQPATVNALDALDDMWAAVDAVRTQFAVEAERPANSVTLREYAERYGLPEKTADHQLRGLVAKGALRKHRVLLPAADGRMCAQNVYEVVRND